VLDHGAPDGGGIRDTRWVAGQKSRDVTARVSKQIGEMLLQLLRLQHSCQAAQEEGAVATGVVAVPENGVYGRHDMWAKGYERRSTDKLHVGVVIEQPTRGRA
jgi:hypothetical protein